MEEIKNFDDLRSRVKHEPPVEFVLILPRPTFGWPAIKQEKDVKPKRIPTVKLTKFDAKWRSKPKSFQTFYSCPHCRLVVKLQWKLTKHLRSCSKINPARFCCDLCGKGFQKKWEIRKHMLKHSSEKRFCCTKCGFGFNTKSKLLRHSRVKRINKCATCDVRFSCKLLLDRHRSDFHENVFKCDKCLYQTKRERDFMLHKGIHDKSIACNTCQKKFALNQSLNLHQMQHRHGIYATAPEETFDCDKCGKTFSSRYYLRDHRKKMHDGKEVKCKVCDKICKNQAYLLVHSQIHGKVECSICNKMFSKYRMPSHLRSHSAGNIFKCDLCEYSAVTKQNLKMHIERMHLLKILLSDSKHRADFSEFELLEKLKLKYQSSATTNEKKFKCEKCPKAYITSHALNQHKRKVHPEKLFECEICRKTFKAKESLKCHKATVHSKKE